LACDYLAFLLVKSIWQKFFSSALFVVGFVGSQNWLVSCGLRFDKLCFSFGRQVFDSVCFGSVKVGFRLFGVLAKHSFCSTSKFLSQFCFRWSRLLIIWRFDKSCFLLVAKD
jgi:hypothetical protein